MKTSPSLANLSVSCEKKNSPHFFHGWDLPVDENLPTSWRFAVREVDENLAKP